MLAGPHPNSATLALQVSGNWSRGGRLGSLTCGIFMALKTCAFEKKINMLILFKDQLSQSRNPQLNPSLSNPSAKYQSRSTDQIIREKKAITKNSTRITNFTRDVYTCLKLTSSLTLRSVCELSHLRKTSHISFLSFFLLFFFWSGKCPSPERARYPCSSHRLVDGSDRVVDAFLDCYC